MASELSRRTFIAAAGTAAASSTALAADSGQSMRPKIVGICGSPRQGRTTAAALQVCLEAAAAVDARIETELIELAGMKIDGSLAAGIPLEEGQRDDFPKLAERLSDPRIAGIVIATPVYFGNMSSLCKAFLERCNDFRKTDTFSNTVAGVVAVGGSRNGGQELTIQSVQAVLFCHEMLLVGDGKPTSHRGATVWSGAPGGVTKDEFGMSTCRNLGRRVAEVAIRMA